MSDLSQMMGGAPTLSMCGGECGGSSRGRERKREGERGEKERRGGKGREVTADVPLSVGPTQVRPLVCVCERYIKKEREGRPE